MNGNKIDGADDQSTLIKSTLTSIPPQEYGEPAYRNHILEQYKTYLAMTDKISERRAAANTFFTTVNTGLLSALGFAKFGEGKEAYDGFIAAVSVAALPLCYSWYRLIRAYKDLNTAKFKVVHEIEKLLPIRPYDAEWEAVGRGKNRKLYFPFTHVEQFIPWVYMALYCVLIGYSIVESNNDVAKAPKAADSTETVRSGSAPGPAR